MRATINLAMLNLAAVHSDVFRPHDELETLVATGAGALQKGDLRVNPSLEKVMAARSSLFALTLCAIATPALAVTPPPGTNEADLQVGSGDANHTFTLTTQNHFLPGAYVMSSSGGTAAATSTLSALNMPVPALDSQVSVTVGDQASQSGARAFAQGLTNYALVVGGTGDTLLRIIASGGVGVSSFQTAGTGNATLRFLVSEANNGPVIYQQNLAIAALPAGCSDGVIPYSFSTCAFGFSVNSDFLVHTNTVYDVHMDVTSTVFGAAGSIGPGTDTVFANVDPRFAVQGPFTLTLSDGFGGASGLPGTTSVPEPATWAMMILGLGLAGTALRRRPARVREAA